MKIYVKMSHASPRGLICLAYDPLLTDVKLHREVVDNVDNIDKKQTTQNLYSSSLLN